MLIVLQVEETSSETQELGLGGPSPQQLNSMMHQVGSLNLECKRILTLLTTLRLRLWVM